MDHEKVLKAVSGFTIVMALLMFVFVALPVLLFAPESHEDFYFLLFSFAVLTLLSGFDILRGIAGFKITDGKWVKGAVVMGWLNVIFSALSVFIVFLSHAGIFDMVKNIVYLILSILYIYCVTVIKKKNEKISVNRDEEIADNEKK